MEQSNQKVKNPRIRISITGGVGYLIGDTKAAKEVWASNGNKASTIDHYYRNLKTGWQSETSLHYLLPNDWGAGIEYQLFTTQSQMMGNLTSEDLVYYGTIREKIYTNFLGASIFYHQYADEKKYRFYSTIALGWVIYRDEMNLVLTPALITASAPGMNMKVGIESPLIGKLSADLHLSGFYSSLKKYTLNDGQRSTTVTLDKNRENLSRINLSGGLKYAF